MPDPGSISKATMRIEVRCEGYRPNATVTLTKTIAVPSPAEVVTVLLAAAVDASECPMKDGWKIEASDA